LEAIGILNDIHIPFHSKSALDVALTILEDIYKEKTLSTIILNGDVGDFYGVNLHGKMPSDMSIKNTIKDEIYQVNKFLDHICKRFKNVEIVFIEGNHETRLLRYIVKKCPELFDMFSIPELFKLKERKIKFVPYGRNQLYKIPETNLFVRHSPYSYGVNCAYSTLTKKFTNLIFGCTHRGQSVTLKTANQEERYACANRCLIDFDSPIFNYMDSDNWSHGFSVVYKDKSKWFNKEVIIKKGIAMFNGYQYIGDNDFEF